MRRDSELVLKRGYFLITFESKIKRSLLSSDDLFRKQENKQSSQFDLGKMTVA